MTAVVGLIEGLGGACRLLSPKARPHHLAGQALQL